MRPEEACVAQMYRNVQEEQAFLNMIATMEGANDDVSSTHRTDRPGGRVDIYVPPMDITVPEQTVASHQDKLRALERDIESIDCCVQTKLERVGADIAAACAEAQAQWQASMRAADAASEATAVAFAEVRKRAQAQFESDKQAMEQLRDVEMAGLRAAFDAPGFAERPALRPHRGQATHLITKQVIPTFYYEAADALLQWAADSGAQQAHAVGRDFTKMLEARGRPARFSEINNRCLGLLVFEMSSTEASQWPSLRETFARIMSACGAWRE